MAADKLSRSITYSEVETLITGNELHKGEIITITDRGDRGLQFQAISNNQLSPEGIRFMLCPATYAVDGDWIGVWNATKQNTAAENNLAVWNGLVWKAGAVLSGDSPSTDGSGWTLISKDSFTNGEYIEMTFGVLYDFENDWICKQWDNNGNVLGLDFNLYVEMYGNYPNLIDSCDWNFKTSGYSFYNNTCYFVYNNSNAGEISDNSNTGEISNNQNAGQIHGNYNAGQISFNINNGEIKGNSNADQISQNSNAGDISDNSNTGDISDNSNTGEISNNQNAGQIHGNYNAGGIFNNSNAGGISDNSNIGEIIGNANNGEIKGNSNIGTIIRNANNGKIRNNTSIASAAVDISYNINNGYITGNRNGNVADTVVNK